MGAALQKIWHRYTAILHIGTLVLTLGITWGIVQTSVASQGKDIDTLKVAQDRLTENIASIKTDVAVTKSQVADIKDSIGEVKQALNIPMKKR